MLSVSDIIIHLVFIPLFYGGKKGGKSLELSFEHLSGADVESEDNKSGDSALTCESHQPALVSGRRR